MSGSSLLGAYHEYLALPRRFHQASSCKWAELNCVNWIVYLFALFSRVLKKNRIFGLQFFDRNSSSEKKNSFKSELPDKTKGCQQLAGLREQFQEFKHFSRLNQFTDCHRLHRALFGVKKSVFLKIKTWPWLQALEPSLINCILNCIFPLVLTVAWLKFNPGKNDLSEFGPKFYWSKAKGSGEMDQERQEKRGKKINGLRVL